MALIIVGLWALVCLAVLVIGVRRAVWRTRELLRETSEWRSRQLMIDYLTSGEALCSKRIAREIVEDLEASFSEGQGLQ